MTGARDELRYITRILVRDLETLAREVEAYPDEPSLWATPPGTSNSGGNLALHMVGNLQHFIGAQLGKTGYVRDRETEFSGRDVPRRQVLASIRSTIEVVNRVVPSLSPNIMSADFPLPVGDSRVTTEDFLLHLTTHLAYHLGQVDYHRKLVTGQATGVGAQSPAKLYSARPAK